MVVHLRKWDNFLEKTIFSPVNINPDELSHEQLVSILFEQYEYLQSNAIGPFSPDLDFKNFAEYRSRSSRDALVSEIERVSRKAQMYAAIGLYGCEKLRYKNNQEFRLSALTGLCVSFLLGAFLPTDATILTILLTGLFGCAVSVLITGLFRSLIEEKWQTGKDDVVLYYFIFALVFFVIAILNK